jgi:UDP-N-acetylglucosamine--N-acetylmuramyl-(pentapeptide) pyrophosphoryl-undecaprenol N-acetylglucosamine transferase
MKRVLFAAGGTMGHLGPAIAVATALTKAAPATEVSFIGTRSDFEFPIEIPYPRHRIIKVPLPRKFDLSVLLFPLRFLIAVVQSIRWVMRVDVVIGFGGYVATPVYVSAWLLRRRIILHEANALPGFANKVGRALGGECFANFEQVGRSWGCAVVGMPLRQEIIDYAKELHQRVGDQSTTTSSAREVLVMGGSQGSKRINEALWNALPHLGRDLRFRHAVGTGNLDRLPVTAEREGYEPIAFIDAMAEAYQSADLVIARAGAVTCAELIALGKRAILVPLGHGNGEQSFNAQALVESGNAISIADSTFDAEWLIANLPRALSLQPKLPRQPRLDAVEAIVSAILNSSSRDGRL